MEKLPAVQETGDAGSTPLSGRSPEEEMATYCNFLALENPVDRGAWWATVHGSQSRLTQTTRISAFSVSQTANVYATFSFEKAVTWEAKL